MKQIDQLLAQIIQISSFEMNHYSIATRKHFGFLYIFIQLKITTSAIPDGPQEGTVDNSKAVDPDK